MEKQFPGDGVELTTLLVVTDIERSRWFYRDGGKNLRAYYSAYSFMNKRIKLEKWIGYRLGSLFGVKRIHKRVQM